MRPPHLHEQPKLHEHPKSRSADRFWNALTAIIYLVCLVFAGLGSFIVLPFFGYAGAALIGMTILCSIIGVILFWVFTKIFAFLDIF